MHMVFLPSQKAFILARCFERAYDFLRALVAMLQSMPAILRDRLDIFAYARHTSLYMKQLLRPLFTPSRSSFSLAQSFADDMRARSSFRLFFFNRLALLRAVSKSRPKQPDAYTVAAMIRDDDIRSPSAAATRCFFRRRRFYDVSSKY